MTRRSVQTFTVTLVSFASLAAFTSLGSDTARAATRPTSIVTVALPAKAVAPMRWRAMRFALNQAGKPYVYGNAGPGSYDCSGLVMTAYHHAGKSLPHNTGAMLSSGKLTRISKSSVRWGDLAFFGTGHVELFGHWINGAHTKGVTFGAHHSGTRISYRTFNSAYYGPTAYYRVNR